MKGLNFFRLAGLEQQHPLKWRLDSKSRVFSNTEMSLNKGAYKM